MTPPIRLRYRAILPLPLDRSVLNVSILGRRSNLLGPFLNNNRSIRWAKHVAPPANTNPSVRFISVIVV